MGTDKWREGESSLTKRLQFNTKLNEKIAGMKFQLIALVIRSFPGIEPQGKGWPELWTDQPNSCFY